MASSQRALHLFRCSVPGAPRLVRPLSTTLSRSNIQQPSSTSTLPQNIQGTGKQAFPTTSTPTAPQSSSQPSPTKLSHIASPLHNPSPVPVEERPPYQLPAADPTPLPAAPSSFEGHQGIPSHNLKAALDAGPVVNEAVDWGTSYLGLSVEPFSERAQAILQAPIPMDDVEVKPDGIIYLPEIKYRRILNAAFGPGGWGLAPRGELHVGDKIVTREFALVVAGRFVALARGECGYFGEDNIPNAVEGCKSNALTRCCKDLGIASELWDPRFIRRYIKEYTRQIEVYYGYGTNAKKKVITIRKDDEVMPPYRPIKPTTAIPSSIPANMATTATKTGITNPTSAKPIATTTTPKPVNNLNATVVKAAGYKPTTNTTKKA